MPVQLTVRSRQGEGDHANVKMVIQAMQVSLELLIQTQLTRRLVVRKLLFPLGAAVALILSISFSPGPVQAVDCNNKVCNADKKCVNHTNGPTTHCMETNGDCDWTGCVPE